MEYLVFLAWVLLAALLVIAGRMAYEWAVAKRAQYRAGRRARGRRGMLL